MKTNEVIARASKVAKKFRVDKGRTFRLKNIDPDDTLGFTKEEHKPMAKQALATGVQALAELQDKLYAQDKWAVLLIFQAMDAAGKDGAIKHVMSGVNPQGCQVYSFKAPIERRTGPRLPLALHEGLPKRGRSAFSTAVTTRRRWSFASIPNSSRSKSCRRSSSPSKIWDERFEDIRDFERYLTPQRRRRAEILSACLQEGTAAAVSRTHRRPEKNWKFSSADAAERDYWDDYMNAYEQMIRQTATRHAPGMWSRRTTSGLLAWPSRRRSSKPCRT